MSGGYALAISPCVGCGLTFAYHPARVPSIRTLDGVTFDPAAPRQPICGRCVAAVNPERLRMGLDPIEVLPGAYDPAPEEELD